MAPHGAHAYQAPTSALDLAVQSARHRGDGHGCGARALWAPSPNAQSPNFPWENQPPRYPQTPPAQSCSLSWRNADGRDPGSTATPPATRGTAPYALPWSPHRSAAEWHRPLVALGHIGPLAPKHHERQQVPDQYSQPAGSTATLPPPFLGLQVTIQRVADVL